MNGRNYNVSGAFSPKKPRKEDMKRPPLGPSEKNNNTVLVARNIQTREVPSRYKSPSPNTNNVTTHKRCPSPNVMRTSSSPRATLPHRAQSAERTRPSTPTRGVVSDTQSSCKKSLWPSMGLPSSERKRTPLVEKTDTMMFDPKMSLTKFSYLPPPSRGVSPRRKVIQETNVIGREGKNSPSRARTSTLSNSCRGNMNSVINYISDARKGKKSAGNIDDAHKLRMLYNKYMQWRFVNARAEDALSIQKTSTETVLRNVWGNTSEMRDAVVLKRIKSQQLKEEIKLNFILKEQLSCLEEWTAVDETHCSSLSGAIEALKASTFRLPVTGSAKADVNSVRNAVNSAVDVMQATGYSVCNLISKIESMKGLVSELLAISVKEQAMLNQCRELLASAATLQIYESSLSTHLIQLKHANKIAKTSI